jgi:hypothetical protein
MRRARYSFRRATLTVRDSWERFCRRASTDMPIVGASLRGIPASYVLLEPHKFDIPLFHTFNSVKVKPRPALTRRLYLIVGHRTIGLSLSTGRGATAAAFERRALRRLNFRPGYLCVRFSTSYCFLCILPGRSEPELVVANPCGNLP